MSALVRRATPDDADALARVHVASWLTTYRGLVPDAFLDQLSHERSRLRWERYIRSAGEGSFVLVVEDPPGNIAGLASGGPVRPADASARFGAETLPGLLPGEGEVYAIYLPAESQRRGLGSLLMRAAAVELAAQGLTAMLVWVLAENRSRLFYEALGGREVGRQDIEIGGKVFEEIAYRWPDLSRLSGETHGT